MPSSNVCSPTLATRRRPERETFGPEITTVSKRLGVPFMPHQQLIADVGGEIDPGTGLPAYREIIVTMPRQQGKTILFVSFQCHRTNHPRWSHPQRSIFTGQTGKDARDKWLDEIFPLINNADPLLSRRALSMNRGMGNEHVRWVNDSVIRLLSTSESVGHSRTVHQVVMDEIWRDQDNRREQGLRPATSTIRDAQILACSTAGTLSSTFLEQKVKAGRAAVKADTGRGIAYFEWMAPDDWDMFDDDSYFGFMPALCPDPYPECRCGDGAWKHTLTLDVIRAERDGMDVDEFTRAYGNRTHPGKRELKPITSGQWAARAKPRKRMPPRAEPAFFVHVSEDSDFAAIGVSYVAAGMPYVALLDYRPGTAWLVDRCKKLAKKYQTSTWAVEGAGAAGAYVPDLRDVGVDIETLTAREVGQAFVYLQKLVKNGGLWHSGDGTVAVAIEGSRRRNIGEGLWVVSSAKSEVDVTPYFAMAGAAWTLKTYPPGGDFAFVVGG